MDRLMNRLSTMDSEIPPAPAKRRVWLGSRDEQGVSAPAARARTARDLTLVSGRWLVAAVEVGGGKRAGDVGGDLFGADSVDAVRAVGPIAEQHVHEADSGSAATSTRRAWTIGTWPAFAFLLLSSHVGDH
jgi:hypothetical protein